MTSHTFEQAPDTARVCIYGAHTTLDDDQVAELTRHMDGFLAEWRSHGREIEPAWTLIHKQFLVIAVDEAAMSLSGCSIDSMFRAVEEFGRKTSLDFSRSGNHIFYRDDGAQIRRIDRLAFSDQARQGAVDAETIVFNNAILTLSEFRKGKWELPMRESWHMQAFGKSLQSTT